MSVYIKPVLIKINFKDKSNFIFLQMTFNSQVKNANDNEYHCPQNNKTILIIHDGSGMHLINHMTRPRNIIINHNFKQSQY